LANPVILQDRFPRMWRDNSRDQLPVGAAWDLADYIPNLAAPLRKRGGWSYEGADLTTLDAGASVPNRVVYAPFAGGGQLIAIDDVGKLLDLTNGVDRGDATASYHTPFLYRDTLIIPAAAVGQSVKKYTGSGAPADLGGSPPQANVLAIYKDRLAAAVTNRVYFSGAGNAESWDTTNRYLDASAPVVGLAALRNALLILHAGSVERARGDIPPGSAAANMTLETLFNDVGMIEGDALAVTDAHAYFADESGIYETDGASISDLTQQGGIQDYWRDQVTAAGASLSLALGVWRGYLFCSLLGSSAAYVDFLICEIRSRSWFRFKNIRAKNFSVRYGTTDEVYFSNQDSTAKKVGKCGSCFSPASGVKNDADGDAVAPVLETGFYNFKSRAKKRVRHVYVSHDTRDAASDNPAQTVSYLTSPEATSYTALSPTLTETTAMTRVRRSLGAAPTNGIAFKLAQSNASSDTRLYAIEADVHGQEGSRR
jgi:hypothetical protein